MRIEYTTKPLNVTKRWNNIECDADNFCHILLNPIFDNFLSVERINALETYIKPIINKTRKTIKFRVSAYYREHDSKKFDKEVWSRFEKYIIKLWND